MRQVSALAGCSTDSPRPECFARTQKRSLASSMAFDAGGCAAGEERSPVSLCDDLRIMFPVRRLDPVGRRPEDLCHPHRPLQSRSAIRVAVSG